MVETATLKARVREARGKGAMKRLRREGRIPAVVYSGRRESVPLDLDAEEFMHLLHHAASEHVFLTLEIEGEEEPRSVLLQEIQHEVLGENILHVDFREVLLTEKLRARVPIEPVGESAGVKQGGVLEQILHEVEVECLPTDLPGSIDVDVSALEIGHSLKIAEMDPPPGVTLVSDEDLVVFTVAAPRVAVELEEEAAEAEEAAEEPEVVGKAADEEGSGEGE